MSPSEAPAITNPYRLSTAQAIASPSILGALARLAPVLADQHRRLVVAFAATVVGAIMGLLGPMIIGRTVDRSIRSGDFHGVLTSAALLLVAYLTGLVATYVQAQQMGRVGRFVLFNLRNTLFTKLQSLPLEFFNENKAGDLISRINNDTDKLNQFFSQALVQFAANVIVMIGAGLFLLSLNPRLGLAALAPAAAVLAITRLTAGWMQRKNLGSLQALGALSGEVQESVSNFRVILAFNRVDYFEQQFAVANDRNFRASVAAGIANTVLLPLYGLALHVAQIVVIAYGFHLISAGRFTVGLLIGFLLYVNSFYMPLRQLAALWSSFQLALASLDRISAVLSLDSNMPQAPAVEAVSGPLLAFEHVTFGYGGGAPVLRDVSFEFQRGRTYALVGPTGGGKTTTALLMARLYDPTGGRVLLDGRDIRSVSAAERAARIGFILQEPFLFTGTVRDNLVYGHEGLLKLSDEDLAARIGATHLDALLERFPEGLATPVTSAGQGLSLGQKQIVAFMRAVLREPDLLILDEATANIDTVTEQLLERILRDLPSSTTRVIIAHRLNTIANADEILFINAGEVTRAGSMQDALDLLLHHTRES
ncbi:putative ABC transporter ATP-binding protein [Luteitalea sp. TBR-22]|uniref:ABC transporter ATP-binding protein n=1 Tax=Luteitalea sp. TBR-22 TaxID=2802971 RepID=UPI001AF1ED5C|nr:ABC transporter ATP-binding protein [Luteitalea sp. TBR-22]BCS35061.1 putative ABC transporter ATP-binding protein [Luteitalea sp. TBR-22]